MYGSITSQQIADELKAKAGLEVDKRKIELREPIRSLGTHKVAVHLASELAAGSDGQRRCGRDRGEAAA